MHVCRSKALFAPNIFYIRLFEHEPYHTEYDPLAQQAEQLPFKQWVWSSNLQRVTNKKSLLSVDKRDFLRNAFLAERDVHFVGDVGFASDARLRRVGRTQFITYHSEAASLITSLKWFYSEAACSKYFGILRLEPSFFFTICVIPSANKR